MPVDFRQHPTFQGRPDRAQFARGGAWEQAWAFGRDALPSANALATYLHGAEEVAFEAFFGSAFFGVRFTAPAADLAASARACVAAFGRAERGAAFFAALPFAVRPAEIAFAEIGAVNAWRSVGAPRLAPIDCRPERATEICRTLQSHALARDHTHAKAIEFAFTGPPAHWFALPLAGADTPFAVEEPRLRAALAFVRSVT